MSSQEGDSQLTDIYSVDSIDVCEQILPHGLDPTHFNMW
jgi:hypothetical protein